jgi:hypothetical protein
MLRTGSAESCRRPSLSLASFLLRYALCRHAAPWHFACRLFPSSGFPQPSHTRVTVSADVSAPFLVTVCPTGPIVSSDGAPPRSARVTVLLMRICSPSGSAGDFDQTAEAQCLSSNGFTEPSRRMDIQRLHTGVSGRDGPGVQRRRNTGTRESPIVVKIRRTDEGRDGTSAPASSDNRNDGSSLHPSLRVVKRKRPAKP